MIKRFLIILVLIFNLPNLSIADDIRDFQIEGMSIGDSLLNYINKDDIDNAPVKFYPKSKEFKQTDLEHLIKTETYDAIAVALRTDDANYIIHEIKGFKRSSSHEECLNSRDEIVDELKNLFKNDDYKINSYERETWEDKDSIYKSVDFLFESGSVRLYCINWSKEIRESMGGFYDDSLTVIIYDSEFLSFLKTNAF